MKDSKMIILSCSESIEKYVNFISNKNIISTIKTSNIYTKGKEDFFFYDEGIYEGHRKDFNYNLNDKVIKVLFRKNENYTEDLEIKPDIDFYIENSISFILDEKDIVFNYKDFNKISYNLNLFFPIILKVILFFIHLGIKDFDIFGMDWFNSNNLPFKKHFLIDKNIKNKIGFDTLMGSFYSNIFLEKLIKKYNLNIRVFSEFSQISTAIPRISLTNKTFFQKSNLFQKCLNDLKHNVKSKHFYKILNLCNESKFYNEEWYRLLIIIITNIDFRFKNIDSYFIENKNNHINNKIFKDILLTIGIHIGM